MILTVGVAWPLEVELVTRGLILSLESKTAICSIYCVLIKTFTLH